MDNDFIPSISFEFDGVLTNKKCLSFCFKLKDAGFNIFIITSRKNHNISLYANNDDLLTIINLIKPIDVVYTHDFPKEDFLTNSKILLHIDDDEMVVNNINHSQGFTRSILFKHNDSLDIILNYIITYLEVHKLDNLLKKLNETIRN